MPFLSLYFVRNAGHGHNNGIYKKQNKYNSKIPEKQRLAFNGSALQILLHEYFRFQALLQA